MTEPKRQFFTITIEDLPEDRDVEITIHLKAAVDSATTLSGAPTEHIEPYPEV